MPRNNKGSREDKKASSGRKTGVTGRTPAIVYTPQQVVDGMQYNDTEPNEFPDDADDIPAFKVVYDRFDDKYWDLVDDFWVDFLKTASDDEKLRLYRTLGSDGPRVVEKGLRKKAVEDAESSNDEAPSVEKTAPVEKASPKAKAKASSAAASSAAASSPAPAKAPRNRK